MATITINPNKCNIEEDAKISNNRNNTDNINNINKDKNRESTISFNPRNKHKQRKATISDNPRHTSNANAINQEVDDDDNLTSADDDTEIHHLRSKRKINNYESMGEKKLGSHHSHQKMEYFYKVDLT